MSDDWDPFADPADADSAPVVVEKGVNEKESASWETWLQGDLAAQEEEPPDPWNDSVFVEQAREASRQAAERERLAKEAAIRKEEAAREAQRREVEERKARRLAREASELEAVKKAADAEAEAAAAASDPAVLERVERRARIREFCYFSALSKIGGSSSTGVERNLNIDSDFFREDAVSVAATMSSRDDGASSSATPVAPAAGSAREPEVPMDPEEERSKREDEASAMAKMMGIKINFKKKGSSEDTQLPVGLLFPDHSSRSLRLLSGARNLPGVTDMIDQATDVLGFGLLDNHGVTNIYELFRGAEAIPSWLEETRVCQPAMYITQLAAIQVLGKRRPGCLDSVQAVAGISLGEFAALTYAGVFDFELGFQLVCLRGEAMQDATSACPQRMASVVGLSEIVLAKLCEEATQGEPGAEDVCEIAQHLFPEGYCCAGSEAAINRLLRAAKSTKGCKQVQLLQREGFGAFHTRLMDPARDRLREALRDSRDRMRPPRCDVYMGVNGRKIAAGSQPAKFIDLLCDQLTLSVRWEDTVQAMLRDGVRQFYECGPLQQLKGMMGRIDPKSASLMISVDHIVENVKEPTRRPQGAYNFTHPLMAAGLALE